MSHVRRRVSVQCARRPRTVSRTMKEAMATALSRGLFLLLASGFLQTASANTFEVKTGNETCILAKFEATFVISYETIDKRMATSFFNLSKNATVNPSSSCNNMTVPQLVISFGDGHSIGMNFSKDSMTYRVEVLSISYNASDRSLFPNATSGGLITVVSNVTNVGGKMNTTYTCFSGYTVHLKNVTVTMSNIQMEAFLPDNTFSKNETLCDGDVTTTLPTTVTTTIPTPTTSPSSNPGNPAPRTYNISGVNETCLLAQMGLQLNITYVTKNNKTAQKVFNIQPNVTNSNGNCSHDWAFLQLTDDSTVLTFRFVVNTTSNKFYLKEVGIITNLSSAQRNFSATNASLTYLQTSVGKSYMCRAKQTLQVTPEFSINAFQFHIQLFKINDGKFGPAEECKLDQDNMLIPIIVGAALAGLVLIVLIAYLIGRKRSHAGYQTI
uniref:Lysosome-associated membrane glycoprotein 1 n=1 Tax=Callorhinchus milii TaxID=7868 RepID=V9KCK3_CALMI|eukprot:gi/632971620/ref/XP_007902260.1/ PREDICTED: lysosome-associated membrane glycoprotein 1 [Callorhinchus milii]